MKMYRGVRNNTFVCMDEVSEQIEHLNYVIYNPTKDAPHERVNKLYDRIKERFGVELSSEQLNYLTKFGVDELHRFVKELQRIIKAVKK